MQNSIGFCKFGFNYEVDETNRPKIDYRNSLHTVFAKCGGEQAVKSTLYAFGRGMP